MTRMLSKEGFNILSGFNGMEGLALAKSAHPDVVVLDVMMGGMDGWKVLDELKRDVALASVPVIMLTSSSEQSDILACYENGANSFIRKPVDFGEFTEKLHRLQAYWLGVNEPVSRR